jgi:hypothetical protein
MTFFRSTASGLRGAKQYPPARSAELLAMQLKHDTPMLDLSPISCQLRKAVVRRLLVVLPGSLRAQAGVPCKCSDLAYAALRAYRNQVGD